MYTLITGASSGIGYEFAKVCAQNGQNLILVARSEATLQSFAKDLMTQNKNIDVQVIPRDLSEAFAVKNLIQEIQNKNLQVNVVMNNAGFGDHGAFQNIPWKRQQEMIQLNILALTELTYSFLPTMIAHKKGQILNVASTAAFQPGPMMAVYFATKAFVLSFSEALAEELSGTGVTVTALCPGPTRSGFQKSANMNDVPLFEIFNPPSSLEVAQYGYQSMQLGKTVAIHGFINNLAVQLLRMTPRSLVVKVVKRLQAKN